jgi:hypothetical protein
MEIGLGGILNTNKLNSVKNFAFAMIGGLVLACPSHAATTSDNPQNGQTYHFTLIQGKGSAVCEAYLTRLNSTDYTTPPYCDIPEATSVPGFSPLRRVPLTAEEIALIRPGVTAFDVAWNKGSKVYDEGVAMWQSRYGNSPDVRRHGAEELIQGGWKIWRYDPPVDIDNDGETDNVLVWQAGQCGHPIQTQLFQTDGRKPTLGYILASGNDRLDIPRTNEIFGHHPVGGNEFRPIGPTIGIFKYQQLYYIDTFLFDGPVNQWGFLPYSYSESEEINTLAVFLRQHGKTRRVCTYHMTETD